MTDSMLSLSRREKLLRTWAAAAVAVALAAGCSSGGEADGAASPAESGSTATGTAGTGSTARTAAAGGLFDNSIVHDIAVTYDEAVYDEMIADFVSTGDKGWIKATVTIDGTTFRDVGLRLKGNSSLMGLRNANGNAEARGGANRPAGGATAETPNALPWLIRLDKYVDDANFKGTTELVVRSNNSSTSLNEAVALELLGLSGQATQLAVATSFRVNGGDAKLRLAIENPNDEWDEANFGDGGVLYKAESGGDYSYRGDDAASYAEIFDQETDTDEETFGPLAEFLKFINQSDDATFAADLDEHLDIDAFAKYLAGQALVSNSDDIDGPGNNSYLHFDEETGRMTIVSWDLNLSFGGMGGGAGGAPGAFPGGNRGGLATPPSGATGVPTMPDGRAGGMGGGMGGRSNILVTRFMANAEFAAAYEASLAAMKADLFASGTAQQVLDRWTKLLTDQASALVPAATVTQEAANISRFFTA